MRSKGKQAEPDFAAKLDADERHDRTRSRKSRKRRKRKGKVKYD